MVVVTVELWPKGDKESAQHLGTMVIGNVHREDSSPDNGNYEYMVLEHAKEILEAQPDSRWNLSKWGRPGQKWKSGGVMGFPRLRLGPWDLIFRVLQTAVGTRNPRS